jgi:hypothetical protein
MALFRYDYFSSVPVKNKISLVGDLITHADISIRAYAILECRCSQLLRHIMLIMNRQQTF